MRVARGTVRHRRHKKIRKLAKGYRSPANSTFVKAKEAVIKAGQHAYRDRRRKKREFRSLWIIRLNAAVRAQGSTYAKFIHALKTKNVALDRKALSELAVREPETFAKVLQHILS